MEKLNQLVIEILLEGSRLEKELKGLKEKNNDYSKYWMEACTQRDELQAELNELKEQLKKETK